MILTGQYRRTLDDKHRLPLPKPLRGKGLEAEPWYVTPGLDGCLAVYPEADFARLSEKLASGSPTAPQTRDYSRLFFSQAACVELDSQCRFRIPAQLVDWAGLDGEVTIVGVRDHLEVWAASRWDNYVATRDHQYDELAVTAFQTNSKPSSEIATPASLPPK